MVTPSAIVDALRSDILELRFSQGQPLREIAVSQRFGASRRSVREAMLLLSNEGLVSHERNRGARVRRFSEADITDLYKARAVLESAGARACGVAPDSAIDAVQLALIELRRAALQGQDTSRHAIADTSFHASVIALAGSARLDGFFARIRGEMGYAIRLLQRQEVVSGRGRSEVLADHERITAAVVARDAVAAEAAVLNHVRVNERILQAIATSSE